MHCSSPLSRRQPAAGNYTESEIRAVYLYNLAVFVRWPDSAFAAPSSPFRICIIGNDALRSTVRRVIADEHVEGRRMELGTAQGLRDCHIVYVEASALPEHPSIRINPARTPRLSVSNAERFALSGGMIELRRKAKRIRPSINLNAVRAAGLRVSSKLLRLARIVDSNKEETTP